MSKLIYGVGINDKSIPMVKDGKIIMTYSRWVSMLERCYAERNKTAFPSYVGVEVSDTFKNYATFSKWCENQIGSNLKDFELDKDIIGNGRLYSEDTCCFVPYQINSLFVLRGADRGPYPIGVTKIKKCNTYIARLNIGKERKYLGAFPTPELAYNAYIIAKEARVEELAEQYKNQIRQDVYEKLVAYKVKE